MLRQLLVIHGGGGRHREHRRICKVVVDRLGNAHPVDGVGDRGPELPVPEYAAAKVKAQILHHRSPAVPELIVAVEGGRGGGVGIVVDEMYSVDLEVVPSVLGGHAGVERHGLKMDFLRSLPPQGIHRQVIRRLYKGAGAHRVLLGSIVGNDGEVHQAGQAIVGPVQLDDHGGIACGIVGRHVPEPRTVDLRFLRQAHGIDHIVGGELLAAGEGGAAQIQGVGPSVIGDGEALAEHRLRLKLIVQAEEPLVDQLHHRPVLHPHTGEGIPAVGGVAGHGEGAGHPDGGLLRPFRR